MEESKQRRMHSINWDIICSGKNVGGLNLTKLELRNIALLVKWWWKFMTERDRKWMRFICNKYGEDFIYNQNVPPKNMSLMFKDIWRC